MDDHAPAPNHGTFLSWRQKHALRPGTPCYNCATALLGPWCYACGQAGEDFHRHAHHLVFETLESFFHADGRFWRTFGRLVTDPARLTRDYLAGKRVPQVPPLRLYLITLFLLFLVAGWATRGTHMLDFSPDVAHGHKSLDPSKVHLDLGLPPDLATSVNAWLQAHLGRAIDHPQELLAAMQSHAHDFAFLMLPIAAFTLATIFIFRRDVMLFDHFIFSMHSMSFQGLLICTAILCHSSLGSGRTRLLMCAAPVHLFAHMRGVYGTGLIGTLGRMALLFVGTMIGFILLLAGLVFAGLALLPA
jgi:hypothetical protein